MDNPVFVADLMGIEARVTVDGEYFFVGATGVPDVGLPTTSGAVRNIFEHIFKVTFGNRESGILRDWDSPDTSIQDLSLSRCSTTSDVFKPSAFKFDKPTPGEVNDCTGTMVAIAEIIAQVSSLANGSMQIIVHSSPPI